MVSIRRLLVAAEPHPVPYSRLNQQMSFFLEVGGEASCDTIATSLFDRATTVNAVVDAAAAATTTASAADFKAPYCFHGVTIETYILVHNSVAVSYSLCPGSGVPFSSFPDITAADYCDFSRNGAASAAISIDPIDSVELAVAAGGDCYCCIAVGSAKHYSTAIAGLRAAGKVSEQVG